MTAPTLDGALLAGPWRSQLPLPLPGICDIPGPPQAVCELSGDVAAGAADSVFGDIVDALIDGFARVLRIALTWWTTLPAPELTEPGGGPGTALAAIRDYTGGLQVALLTAGIMFAAARMALAKRGAVAGEAQESFLMLGRAVFASMAFAAMITAGTRAGDAFANWVLVDAGGGDLTQVVTLLLEFDEQTRSQVGRGVLLVVGLLGTISMLIQLVMLVVRQALLIVVVAVIPLAAAASGTGPGSQGYKKLLSWSLAFVLWKPVGALVYAIAFTVIGEEKQTDPQMVLLGLILLVMSVVVLPALIRLVAPAVATLGGGGGATAALAGGATGIAMTAIGDRSNARKVSEGENAAGGAPSAGANNQPPAPPAPPSGSSGRPLSGAGGGSGPTPNEAVGAGARGGRGASGGGARATQSGAGKAAAAQGAGGGAGGAAAAAGPAGAAVAAGQMAQGAIQQGASALDDQVRDVTESGPNPDALGPGEVRR